MFALRTMWWADDCNSMLWWRVQVFLCAATHVANVWNLHANWRMTERGRGGFPSARWSGRVCFSFIEHGWSIRHTGRATCTESLAAVGAFHAPLSLPPSILLAPCCPRGPLDFGKVHAPRTQYCTKIHSLGRRAPHKWIRGAAADARVSPRVFRNTRVYMAALTQALSLRRIEFTKSRPQNSQQPPE